MHKSKLQEYCQKMRIEMPEYTTEKEGLDHCPAFKAVVNVGGLSFTTTDLFRNSKEAQNEVAKLAIFHFSGDDSSSGSTALPSAFSNLLQPGAPSSQNTSFGQTTFVTKDDERFKDSSSGSTALPSAFSNLLQPGAPSSQNTSFGQTNFVIKYDERFKDMAHHYKNRLYIYAQKSYLPFPTYTSEREGPPHASRFKSKVTLGGKVYESPEYSKTVKEAENAAAKIAFLAVSPGEIKEVDTGFSKNVLREFLWREYSCLAKYTTSQSGASHEPTFVSTVEINGEAFKGDEAKTKKQAETNAAKVAYSALKDRKLGLENQSMESDIKQLQHQLEPITMSENNKVVPEEATKPEHVPKITEAVVEEKDVKSSAVADSEEVQALADSLSEEDCSAAASVEVQSLADSEPEEDSSNNDDFEEVHTLADSAKRVNLNGSTASVPSLSRRRRKLVARSFKPGMELPPDAILRFSDEKYIAYEVPNED